LILLVGRRFNLRQKLAIKESFDRPFLQGNSQNIIQSIIATTLLFELAGVLIMLNVFSSKYGTLDGLWYAIFHSVSAWNNAGFGLLKDNLMSFTGSWSINFAITMLIIFGGIGYQVIIETYLFLLHKINKRQERIVFSLNFKVATSTTLLLLLGGTAIFFLVEHNNPNTLSPLNLKDKLLAAWFQSVTSRTAGFNSIDIGKMTISGLFTTMGLMFIGASPGGTGGGIKTTTLRILTNCTRSVLRGNEEVVMYNREVPLSLVLKAVAVVFGSTILVIFMTFSIAFIEVSLNPMFFEDKYSSIEVLFEVISAFGTVGLSTGITASLSSLSQILLVITMYTGRVGVLLLMAAIVGDTRPRVVQYAEETLLVG
jgi:trk system potassium uptake protein TrkH